jgi:putative flippase GtrA
MFNRQFLIFVFGGFLCAVIDIGMMQLMIFAGSNYISAATGGFFTGLGANYIFHAQLTFRSAINRSTLLRFLTVVFINYLLTILFVSLSFSFFQNALIGKIISLPFIAINGFYLSKRWVFR